MLLFFQAVSFKKALGCKAVHVLDIGAGSGLLSMMAARSAETLVTLLENPNATWQPS